MKRSILIMTMVAGILILSVSQAIAGDIPDNLALQPKSAATITIAASDSLPTSKASATYVCDGIDDHVEIQKAIDTLPESKGVASYWSIGGGSIQLLEGTFYIGATIKFYEKAVDLVGAGKYSTNLMLQKEVNDDMILIGIGKTESLPAGRLAHMTLDGQSALQTKGSGIRMKSGDMMVIEDARVFNFKEHGIFIDAASQAFRPMMGTIEKCRIEQNKKHGIYMGPGTEGWTIRGNWIDDNGTIGQPYHGIYITTVLDGSGRGSCSIIIIGNFLWQNMCTQISIDNSDDIMITSNMIRSSPYENIKLYGGTRLVTITGNSFHSASELGVGFLWYRYSPDQLKKIFEGARPVPHITLGESPTSTARYVTVLGNIFWSPPPELGVQRGTPPSVQPSAILEEEEGSDYTKFTGNVIQGGVTKVILVGKHSVKD